MFQWIFGKQMTPQERLRKNLRSLQRTQRELDREIVKLQQQTKRLQNDIKKSVQNDQLTAAKVQAKDLIRSQNYITRFQNVKLQLQAIELRIQTIKSNDAMVRSMTDAARILNHMNQGVQLPNLQRIVMDFEKQSDIMDQKQEIIDETMEDSMGVDEDELNEDEQANEIINKIVDEIGVDLSTKMNNSAVPQGQINVSNSQELNSPQKEGVALGGDGDNADDLLQQRLNSLKR
ncbi:DOA4-independent degradation protein 4 [Monosporozyma unispora]|nr:ESCRT-III subunit protein did4 [Kazachstania unispora]